MIDRSIYIGMLGAKQASTNMQLISNNLANVNTIGHRASLPDFSTYEIQGAGIHSRAFDVTEASQADFSTGGFITTDRNLDVAVHGDGFFAIQTAGGQEAYTRNGSFQISSDGFLTTSSGQYVMGQKGLIAIPNAKKINIGKDGTITVQPMGQAEKDLTIVDRLKLVNPPRDAIRRGEDGLFYAAGDGGAISADDNVQVQSGMLESSNVNVVTSLVDMIETAREYELQVKMMKAADDNSAKATQLLSLN